MSDRICIIVVGYNRPDAVGRLLDSLTRADYCNDQVDLLISIDKGALQKEIVDIANNYKWKHGEKKIRAFTERQGLRPHIIQCGDVVNDYDAVIVLEDDITVSECFYKYVKQTVSFYNNDDKIGGISLYRHAVNVGVARFFEPEFIGYDVFALQYAQSWGQCWTKNMWNGFRKWYGDNEDFFARENNKLLDMIPDSVLAWDGHSWLKYYMAYIVDKNLYYIYPYYSVATNHSEIGQHNTFGMNSDYQVPLASGDYLYRMSKLENLVKYDVFFERQNYEIAGYSDKRIVLDLYGNKKDFSNANVIISSQALPYKMIDSWQLMYHPHELNCRYPVRGRGIYVYDAQQQEAKSKKIPRIVRTRYDVRTTDWRSLLLLGVTELYEKCLRRIKRK